jgi:hypothetical protein
VGLGIPFAFQKNVVKYAIGVEPSVTYKLAGTASVGVIYKFAVSETDIDGAETGADYNQKIQLNFNYSW